MFKKYISFGYDWYYPLGGMHDFVGSFDTLREAKKCIKDGSNAGHVVRRDTWEVVWQWDAVGKGPWQMPWE